MGSGMALSRNSPHSLREGGGEVSGKITGMQEPGDTAARGRGASVQAAVEGSPLGKVWDPVRDDGSEMTGGLAEVTVVIETHGVVGPTPQLRAQRPGHTHTPAGTAGSVGPCKHGGPAMPLLGPVYLRLGARKQASGRVCF